MTAKGKYVVTLAIRKTVSYEVENPDYKKATRISNLVRSLTVDDVQFQSLFVPDAPPMVPDDINDAWQEQVRKNVESATLKLQRGGTYIHVDLLCVPESLQQAVAESVKQQMEKQNYQCTVQVRNDQREGRSARVQVKWPANHDHPSASFNIWKDYK